MTFDPFADPIVFGPGPASPAMEPDPPPVIQGPLERAVRGDVDALGLVSSTSRSLAELSFNLARKLDDGAGMATAAVAKELRETLKDMAEQAGDDDGAALLDRLSQPADLPTPVRDSPQP
ncbi:hypothetical protein ACIBI0_38810 [Microbispora rosea]|uniref:hypothetical protein n=1 Tax=Microbispora rosea TaxID=58117 RepID=UPI0037B51AD4